MRTNFNIKLDAGLFRWAAVLLCIGGAAWVGASGHDGWGWFLFIALMLAWSA